MSTSTIEKELLAVATHIATTDTHLVVDLEDGRTISVPLEWYPRLWHGTPAERANVEISSYGLHWEDLNEDLSIRGLLLGRRSAESPRSIQRWLDYRARGEKEPILTLPLPPDLEREFNELEKQ